MLNAIIIDDERSSRNALRQKLVKHCIDVMIIGECENGEEGIENIEKKKPDIVFLDVEMPRMNGFTMHAILNLGIPALLRYSIGDGVSIFFVLSGFLITYLLLTEKEKFKTISVKRFYIRRILRIWPLYYLVVILALYVFPHIKALDIPGWSPFVEKGIVGKSLLYLLNPGLSP